MQFAVTILRPYLVDGNVLWESPLIPCVVQNVATIEEAIKVVKDHLPPRSGEIQGLLDQKPDWKRGTYFEVRIAPIPEDTKFAFVIGHIQGSQKARSIMM